MKAFEYVAAKSTGELISGLGWASTEAELDRQLEGRGLVLTRARVSADGGRTRPSRLKRDELIQFTNQLATVTGAGIPLVEALAGIRQRASSQDARRLIGEMVTGLQAGQSLSKVMNAYPRAFPDVYRASVVAGEASGALDRVLRRLSAHLEWLRGMRATTVQALIYPTLLLAAIGILITILLTFVLPRIIALFPAGSDALPRETRVVMGVSDFLVSNALGLGVGLGALTAGLFVALRRPGGKLVLDGVLLRLPRLGSIVRQLSTSKFASTAGILHEAGCDVFTVLETASSTCGNAAMAECFGRATERVRRGETISQALEKEPQIDSLLVQMVAVGEKTGALDECLERVVSHYDEEVPRTVKRFLSFLEPSLLVVAGGVVAFILLAALLPIFELYESMG